MEEVVSSKSRVPRDVAPPSVGIVGRYFLGRVVWGGGEVRELGGGGGKGRSVKFGLVVNRAQIC